MKSFPSWQKTRRRIALAGLCLAVVGCGGNDDPVFVPTPPAPQSTPTISVFAGSLQQVGSQDGVGPAAQFNAPQGIAQDSAGNVYVADTGNHTIRKVTPAGAVTTVAGLAGQQGSADGTSASSRLSSPSGLAVDAAGNVFIADTGNHTIRQLSPAGALTTVAGQAGQAGSATVARFESPHSVAVDSVGTCMWLTVGPPQRYGKSHPTEAWLFLCNCLVRPPHPLQPTAVAMCIWRSVI